MSHDGIVRGSATAANGSTAAVEETNADAVLGRHIAQLALGLVDLPLAGHHAGFLIGIGVTQHDLLDVSAEADKFPVGRIGQQLVHNLSRGPEFLHRFQ
ncbi:hypothetical protein D3C73_1315900 [compost metagenome]